MLFLLWGASGAGKTACMKGIAARFAELAVHDFDEVGVPRDADRVWRQQTAELWLGRAIAYRAERRDMLLCGQLPYGELLACPSADEYGDEILSCLLDCHDHERVRRLLARGAAVEAASQEMLCWASWLRMHAVDPQWRADVIASESAPGMRWERWREWPPNHPRWRVELIDTSGTELATTVERVSRWIERGLATRGGP